MDPQKDWTLQLNNDLFIKTQTTPKEFCFKLFWPGKYLDKQIIVPTDCIHLIIFL